MTSGKPPSSNSEQSERFEDIIEIRDPSINVQDIMRQIRENMANRKSLQPRFSSMVVAEDRLALRAAHESLRAQVQAYGNIGEPGAGLIGRLQFFLKKVIRRLIKRHIEQERGVQEGMMKLTGRLIAYLDQHLENTNECLNRIEKLEKQNFDKGQN